MPVDNPFAKVMAVQARIEQERLEREKREKLQKQQLAQKNANIIEETQVKTFRGKPLDLADSIRKLRQQIAGLDAKIQNIEEKDPNEREPAMQQAEIAVISGKKLGLEAKLREMEARNGKLPPQITVAIKGPTSGRKSK